MANFRPLQPAPMDQEAPSQPQNRAMLPQKPKRTVTLGACVACRKRKSKCDGKRPVCTCCGQKETDCVYELGPNEKPSQAMKRKNEEMQGELSNLRQLYDFLRLRPEQEAMEILRRIRNNPSDDSPSQHIQELANFVHHGNLVCQQQTHSLPSRYPHDHGQPVTLPSLRLALDAPSNFDAHRLPFPGISSMGVEGPTSQRRRYASDSDVTARYELNEMTKSNFDQLSSDSSSPRPLPTSIEAIIHPSSATAAHDFHTDPRLYSIKHWTTVTTDSNLLIELMSAWTTCEYNYYHYIDREAFLDDMASGRTDYCSALLVNALLASACFHSSVVKDRQKPFADISMTTLFYKEARRLWDLEEGKDSVTKLQAGICLFLVLGKHGRDKVGYTFLSEACRVGRALGLFQNQSINSHQASTRTDDLYQLWYRVRAVTAWALFNFQLAMSFTYSFPAIIRRVPSIAIPYYDTPDSKALFRSECAKYVIILDCGNLTRDESNAKKRISLRPEEIEACYLRLTHWWNSRSPEIHPDHAPTRENLLCAMMYHVNIVNLFQATLDNGDLMQQSRPYFCHARSVTCASIMEIHRLLALQATRFGWHDAITFVLHPITVASFGSLEEISRANDTNMARPAPLDTSELYAGLETCLRALASLSSYSYYAQPLFRLLTQKCRALGIQMPGDVQSTLNSITTDEWTHHAAEIVSSQYIADTHKTVTDADCTRMDAIISAWEALSLGTAGKSTLPGE